MYAKNVYSYQNHVERPTSLENATLGDGQNDICNRFECKNQLPLLNDGVKPSFEDADHMYRVCTACRYENNGLFIPAIWYEQKIGKKLTVEIATKQAEAFNELYGFNFKLKTYPRFSANISDIKHDLDILESTEDFVPDVVVIDYADILKPESNNNSGFQKEDETWIALAQLAGERNALVITPTQITKEGQDTKLIQVQHTARWSGKIGHVDAIFGINQTQEEKDEGMQRLNKIMHRHEEFNSSEQCMVLQNFNIGAVHLDSCRYDNNEPEQENQNE